MKSSTRTRTGSTKARTKVNLDLFFDRKFYRGIFWQTLSTIQSSQVSNDLPKTLDNDLLEVSYINATKNTTAFSIALLASSMII